jgi:hypothetical protein
VGAAKVLKGLANGFRRAPKRSVNAGVLVQFVGFLRGLLLLRGDLLRRCGVSMAYCSACCDVAGAAMKDARVAAKDERVAAKDADVAGSQQAVQERKHALQ